LRYFFYNGFLGSYTLADLTGHDGHAPNDIPKKGTTKERQDARKNIKYLHLIFYEIYTLSHRSESVISMRRIDAIANSLRDKGTFNL
jgi:hypothetical protein